MTMTAFNQKAGTALNTAIRFKGGSGSATLRAGVDMGTTKVSTLIAEVVDGSDNVRVIGVGNAPAEGLKQGRSRRPSGWPVFRPGDTTSVWPASTYAA
jgi:hypothetical protein